MDTRYCLTELDTSWCEYAENLFWEVAKAFPTNEFKSILLNLLDDETKKKLGKNPDFLSVDWSKVDSDQYAEIAESYTWNDCVDWDKYNKARSYYIVIDDDKHSVDDTCTTIIVHAKCANMVQQFANIIEEVECVDHIEDEKGKRV